MEVAPEREPPDVAYPLDEEAATTPSFKYPDLRIITQRLVWVSLIVVLIVGVAIGALYPCIPFSSACSFPIPKPCASSPLHIHPNIHPPESATFLARIPLTRLLTLLLLDRPRLPSHSIPTETFIRVLHSSIPQPPPEQTRILARLNRQASPTSFMVLLRQASITRIRIARVVMPVTISLQSEVAPRSGQFGPRTRHPARFRLRMPCHRLAVVRGGAALQAGTVITSLRREGRVLAVFSPLVAVDGVDGVTDAEGPAVLHGAEPFEGRVGGACYRVIVCGLLCDEGYETGL